MTHPANAGYKGGNYWMRSDRSGGDHRRSDMRKEWDNLWVHKDEWEPRQPQDFVKGVKDHQAVRDPRPTIDVVLSSTTTSAASSTGGFTITVTSTTNITDESSIGIELDDSEVVQWTFVNGDLVGNVVTLNDPLIGDVSSGNTVYNADDGSAYFLDTNEVTPSSL